MAGDNLPVEMFCVDMLFSLSYPWTYLCRYVVSKDKNRKGKDNNCNHHLWKISVALVHPEGVQGCFVFEQEFGHLCLIQLIECEW